MFIVFIFLLGLSSNLGAAMDQGNGSFTQRADLVRELATMAMNSRRAAEINVADESIGFNIGNDIDHEPAHGASNSAENTESAVPIVVAVIPSGATLLAIPATVTALTTAAPVSTMVVGTSWTLAGGQWTITALPAVVTAPTAVSTIAVVSIVAGGALVAGAVGYGAYRGAKKIQSDCVVQ